MKSPLEYPVVVIIETTLNNYLIFKDGQNHEKIGHMYRKPDHIKMS